ncbi:helix-turn-helix domain-containing protein [Pantoea agglomerans]|uniref:helix-turn-helix domain-containing protein n=1 Tax=Enterobacter agglomerans TaxID=549 RepID=UPI0023B08CE9|nr:helix-turn-helix domain-containing protein [Pantoea agglomerans]WEC71195.1 helix-turn-helix domain-containing protein [Pantoea agglomerans]
MSVKLSAYVWDGCAASGMKITSVAIMARLADFSSDEGICWPSIATIARQIGAGSSTVRTSIRKLEADGWLTSTTRRKGNRNTSNMYQLNVRKLREAAYAHQPESDASESDTSKSDASRTDTSKSDASKSGASNYDPSNFDPSESGKNAGFHPPESGDDPSVNSKHDPLDKKPICPGAAPLDALPVDKPLSGDSDAVVCSPKRTMWGSEEDLKCAQWIWEQIIHLYEKAAETDGELARPREPNWTAWANDVRLMCSQDQRTHYQICKMFKRIQGDPFWCRNILSPSKLREKWDELVLRLGPVQRSITDISPVDYATPEGFRGY